MSVKCPKCNANNPDTLKFCGECGTQLSNLTRKLFVLCTSLIIFISGMSCKNSSQPFATIGHARVSAIYDVEVVPPYAYALERGILRVLDIRDPKSVQEINSLEFERARVRTALNFPYLYLYGFGQFLGIIDISTPEKPIWVGEFPEITGIMNDGFCLVEDTAYTVRVPSTGILISDEPLLFEILDLKTNPEKPHQVASIDLNLKPQNIEFAYITHSANHAFVLVHTQPQVKIIVIDTSNPNDPQIERTFTLPHGTRFKDIKVQGDLLYLLEARPRIRFLIYKMSEEDELKLLGEHKLNAFHPIDIVVTDDIVAVSSKAMFPSHVHLSIFSLIDLQKPELLYSYRIQDKWAQGLGMSLADEKLYLAGDGGPMPIFDLSNSDSPRFLGQWGFEGGYVEDVVCGAEKMLVVNGGGDFIIYDVQDPSHPHRIVRTQSKEKGTWEDSLAVAIHDLRVLLAYTKKPAQVLDLNQSKQPAVIARFTTRNPTTSAVMSQSHVFLGYRDKTKGGIEVIDLSDEQKPRTVTVVNLEYPVQDIAMGAKRICAAHPNGSLSIVDASHPEQPRLLSLFDPDSPIADSDTTIISDPQVAVSAKGDYAILLNNYTSKKENPYVGHDMLEIVDLRDASKPHLLSQLRIDRHNLAKSSFGLIGNFVVLYSGDILVVDIKDPLQPFIRTRKSIPTGQFQEAGQISLAIDDKNLYLGEFEDGVRIYRLPSYMRD